MSAKSRRRWGRVRRLPSGRWQARYPGPAGTTYPAPVTFRTKTAAERWLVDKEAEIRRDGWLDPNIGRIPIGDYGVRWIEERPGLSDKTKHLYRWLLRQHIAPPLGRIDIADLTQPRVRTWRKTLLDDGASEGTAAKAYRLLRAILNTAVEDGLIRRSPCQIKGAGYEKAPERRLLTIDQVLALGMAIDKRWRALVLVAAFCGLRWGELVGLRRRDIDLKAKKITVRASVVEVDGELVEKSPKTSAGYRVVAIPEFMGLDIRRHLREWAGRGPDGLVFRAPRGGFLRESNFIRRQWRPATESVGLLGLTIHELRHFAATLAAQCGATIRELMDFLGQTSPRAALIYQHAASDRGQLIAEAMSQRVEVASATTEGAREGHDVTAGTESS